MIEEKINLIENRVLHSLYSDMITIKSPSYRSIKYLISFLICSLINSVLVFCIINFEAVSSKMHPYGLILNVIVIGIGFSFTLQFLPLAPSIVLNGLIRNLFLTEEITITSNLLILKRYNLFETKIPISDIRWFEFKSEKIIRDFSGVPLLIPNYSYTLKINLLKKSNSIKFFRSIKENEIEFVSQTIKSALIQRGIVLKEEKYLTRFFLTIQRNSEL
ncbi:hypothetical protein [Daejeonella sp.]|jgi:hypothetical protein|uniref:hypothetical protein n=1 Tax=Daejeonella sp. TaxID=2805397 RepID=UPI0037BF1BF9